MVEIVRAESVDEIGGEGREEAREEGQEQKLGGGLYSWPGGI